MNGKAKQRGFTLFQLIFVVAAIAIIFTTIMGGSCESCAPGPDAAVRAAETNGFTNVRVVDSHGCAQMNGCSDGDAIAYDVTAMNQAEKLVSFVVCCGDTSFGGKGCTIRTR